jgi:hypothetical protein
MYGDQASRQRQKVSYKEATSDTPQTSATQVPTGRSSVLSKETLHPLPRHTCSGILMVFRQRRNVVAAMVNMALPNTMEGRSHQIRANEVRLCVNASKSPIGVRHPLVVRCRVRWLTLLSASTTSRSLFTSTKKCGYSVLTEFSLQ